ncbi:hypothetical protein BURMUCGD1_5072 [Burkholderia multivorans CGD1]|nr:hypothetical protein BURMUCGD1_5072 [Burkholderia multivorans CGD1]
MARRRQYAKSGRLGIGARAHIPLRSRLANGKAPPRRG